MYDIQGYYEAESVEEAIDMLAENPALKVIAGGTDLLIKMHGGQLAKAEFLSIRRIKALEAIRCTGDGTIVIGPLATFSKVYQDPLIREAIPVLSEAAVSMGGPQIRNVATIGGNIANGATSADSAPTLFALNAKLRLAGRKGARIVPIQEFYLGPGSVDLQQELLTEIIISPENYRDCGGHYIKFSMRKAMDIATLGVAVVCRLKAKNIFDDVRIGLGVAGPTPLRCAEAETYAKGQEINAETIARIGRLAVNSAAARTSWRASKEYREHLVEELTKRALKIAVVKAGGVEIA